MTRRMTLCPSCRTIQKAHSICTICGDRVRPEAPQPAAEASRWRRVGDWREPASPFSPRGRSS